MVDLDNSDRLFALAERLVAVESLIFVSEQIQLLAPIMESLLPPAKQSFLTQFFAQTISTVIDSRRCIYGSVSSRALNYTHLKVQVAACKWDISELMSQHSRYVGQFVVELAMFGERLNNVAQLVPLSRQVYELLWELTILCVNKVLVEGYAEPGQKCSSEGRALMQLDLQQLVGELEQLTDLRPIPHKSLVENYIKAYYLPEIALEDWVVRHREYSTTQLITLLNVATHVSRKARLRMIASLEDSQ